MKKMLVAILLLAACTQKNTTETPKQPPLGEGQTGSGDFSGYWVNTQYVDALRQTKSTRTAQGAAEISAVRMPGNDSDSVTIIYGFHEGTSLQLKRDAGGKYALYGEGDTAKAYPIDFPVKRVMLQIGDQYFVRLRDQSGHYRIPEEFLFAGHYTWAGRAVELKPDGRVIGLDSITHYQPLVDYIDAGRQVDQLWMGQSETRRSPYGFIFRNDTLTVYHLNCTAYDRENRVCQEVENGKKWLELIRK